MRIGYFLSVAALALAATPAFAQSAPPTPEATLSGTTAETGLLPVHVDAQRGRILLTLPAADAEGISGRFLYSTALRTGVGSAPVGLDHAQFGPTQILVFRRLGSKVAVQFENPRFRASGGTPDEQAAARTSFAISTAWIGDVAATYADGRILVDVSGFLTQDVMGIATQLSRGASATFRREASLSAADPAATRVFPDNIELEALQTYTSDVPGPEISNIAPDPRQVSVAVRHSLIRLPGPGFVSRRLDPRSGAFGSQAIDYAAPLGQDVVYDLANRFRLERTDPTAPRSTVVKPITFYIDRAAPEPIRNALADGVRWWADAFDAAGFVGAFRVEILPEGVDPLDIRYNVVNWVNRATRGWSYGQTITDPRTGEIVKGAVLLGSLRVRQDILIYEALLGTAATGQGGPADPAQIALARIRQLGAHEVGHALGFEHNFAASTQDRASVMDYPAPRVLLTGGVPDLSDAYGIGVGAWDRYLVDWLYADPAPGTDPDAHARTKADAAMARGQRFVADADARHFSTGQPWGAIWDDGTDPAAELIRMMEVRRVAVQRFGLPMLRSGEPVAALRRRFVPLWLMHRYQVEAAAKLVGGVEFHYAVNGGGVESSALVPAAQQNAALDALIATLDTNALTVPATLIPLLSSGSIGNADRQTDIEVFATAGGPVFDPLVAADTAAQVTLDALLAPERLQRLVLQHDRDVSQPGLDTLLNRLQALVLDNRETELGRRIAYRTVAEMAHAAEDGDTAPGVALALDARLTRIAADLGRARSPAAREWGSSLAAILTDREARHALATDRARPSRVPPGMPIGSLSGDLGGEE